MVPMALFKYPRLEDKNGGQPASRKFETTGDTEELDFESHFSASLRGRPVYQPYEPTALPQQTASAAEDWGFLQCSSFAAEHLLPCHEG